MLFYSTELKKNFETPEACLKAEKEHLDKIAKQKEAEEKKAAARKTRAAEVEAARKAVVEAEKKYRELLTAFTKDYSTYHYSIKSVDELPHLIDLFNLF